ncbi:MAG: alanine racemase [Candidatus Kapabacteria bacterium]|nr:alanine racemase [Candidatus Kapabacteria bacterium]
MRSTVAIINKSNLNHNLEILRKMAPAAGVIGIVKANAYGHGMNECARILQDSGIEFLAVAYPEEGVELRNAGIQCPIIVLVPAELSSAQLFIDYALQPSIGDFEICSTLEIIAKKAGKTIQAHLFLDTAMYRDGILPNQATALMNHASQFTSLNINGICTHFSTSDDPDESITQEQIHLFNETIIDLSKNGFNFKYIHAANSAAAVRFKQSQFNLIRPGLALYGYSPYSTIDLKPVLSLKSHVRTIYQVPEGSFIGYSKKFKTNRDSKIAVVPIGYGDGFFYSQNGRAECLIRGNKLPIVGAICMDQCFVDITETETEINDEVVIIGQQSDQKISAKDIAERIGTIPYEVLTNISARVQRLVED